MNIQYQARTNSLCFPENWVSALATGSMMICTTPLREPIIKSSINTLSLKENWRFTDYWYLWSWFQRKSITLTVNRKWHNLNKPNCIFFQFPGNYIHGLIYERQLISLEEVSKEGEVVFRNVWTDTVRYSKYWLPVLCGLLSTYFTWIMVYLDSNVPGVQPPSPLSPSKYK